MRLRSAAVGNLLLPGSGLLLRDHLFSGLVLLLATMLLLALALLGELLATEGFLPRFRLGLGAGYAGLVCVAGLLWWCWERRRAWQRERVYELHDAAAAAWLQGRGAEALSLAGRLSREAADLSGAWRMLAMIAADQGDVAAARSARRRERRLLERQDP